MAKPKLNHRATTWRAAPADDQAIQIIAARLGAYLGQEPTACGVIRFALRHVAETFKANEQAGTGSFTA